MPGRPRAGQGKTDFSMRKKAGLWLFCNSVPGRLGKPGPCGLPGWAPRLQGRDEFVCRYVRLTQDPCQSADFDYAMQGDDAAFGTTTHDDVASGLANLLETKALQRSHHGGA